MTLIFPKPEKWQLDVIILLEKLGHQSNSFITVKSCRQCGKSWMLSAILLMTALNYPGTNSVLVSLTSKNTYKIFKELLDGLDDFPGIKNINKSLYEIEFANGSSISFRSAAQGSALRGYSLKKNSVLLVDEAAFISEQTYAEILPWSNKNKCPVILCSTPLTKTGTFYKNFDAGLRNEPGFYAIDWATYDKSAYLPSERIEQYRNLLSPGAFKAEILGDWIDDIEGLFNLEQNIWQSDRQPKGKLYGGIDWAVGNSGDYSVLSIFDSTGKQIILEYTNKKRPEEQLAYFSNIIRNLNKNNLVISAETNSLGAVYLDRLKSLCPGYDIRPFVTSNSSKKEIIEYLISRINSGNISLISDEEQRKQLLNYRMEITKSGQITYNGIYGSHDDIVMSNAIALKGLKDLSKTGNYNFSFSFNNKNTSYIGR